MREAEFEAYLRKRGFGDGVVKHSVGAVRELEGALAGKALNTIGVGDLRAYIESLVPRRRNLGSHLPFLIGGSSGHLKK